jgi:hypothetical protein
MFFAELVMIHFLLGHLHMRSCIRTPAGAVLMLGFNRRRWCATVKSVFVSVRMHVSDMLEDIKKKWFE